MIALINSEIYKIQLWKNFFVLEIFEFYHHMIKMEYWVKFSKCIKLFRFNIVSDHLIQMINAKHR